MAGYLGSDFASADPAEASPIKDGASWIRDIKTRLKTFFTVMFDLETGLIKSNVITTGMMDLTGVSAGTYTSVTVNTAGRVTAGSSPASSSSQLWLRVDAANGNDGLGAGSKFTQPFLTLAAAKSSAVSGDLIVVGPGTYNERDLFKNGVNWFFLQGAKITYTGSATGYIFDDSTNGANAAITCSIMGKGVFTYSGTGSTCGVLRVNNASSSIKFECISVVTTATDAIGILVDDGILHAKVFEDITTSGSGAECLAVLGGTSTVYARDITSTQDRAVLTSGGTSYVFGRTISTPGSTNAVALSGGTTYLDCMKIKATGAVTLAHSGASTSSAILNAQVVCAWANAAGSSISKNDAGTMYIKNCVLVSDATSTDSITAGGAVSVVAYTDIATTTGAHANVTATITGLAFLAADAQVVEY